MSLERAAAASVVESPRGSGSTTRRVDPRADLQEATERNAREAREEREAREAEARKAAAAQAAQEEEAAKARADAAAKAQAEAAAAAMAEGALLVTPLRVAAPGAPEPPPEEAGGDQPGLERDDDVVILERAPVPTPPTGAAQGGRPDLPPAQSAGGEPAARTEMAVRMPPSRRAGKAASEPQKAASEPQPAAGSSSSARDVEVASATSGWTPGGGTAVMNVAAQDVRTRLQAQATALRQFTDEFLATRAAIRVSLPILLLLDLDFFLILISSVGARQRTHWV